MNHKLLHFAFHQISRLAHHEAGHAVAAVLRGGSFHRIELSDHAPVGQTLYRGKPCDSAFIAYAGPWAEARFMWPDRLSIDDGVDESGRNFLECVFDILAAQPDDLRSATDKTYIYTGVPDYDDVVRLEVWHRELERLSPAVTEIADLLEAGEEVRHVDVSTAIDDALRAGLAMDL